MKILSIEYFNLHNKFVKAQEHNNFISNPKIVFFISHRWYSQNNPDHDNLFFEQIPRIIFFIIYSCIRPPALVSLMGNADDSLVMDSKVRGTIIQLYYTRKDEIEKTINQGMNFEPLYIFARKFGLIKICWGFATYECLAIYLMMFEMGVFFDYSSLAQQPRTALEELEFKRDLKKLNEISKKSLSIFMWDKSEFSRSWCFIEYLIAKACKQRIFLNSIEVDHFFQGLNEDELKAKAKASFDDHEIKSRELGINDPGAIRAAFKQYINDINLVQADLKLINDIKRDFTRHEAIWRCRTVKEVQDYLINNNIKATNGSDNIIISEMIYDLITDVTRWYRCCLQLGLKTEEHRVYSDM